MWAGSTNRQNTGARFWPLTKLKQISFVKQFGLILFRRRGNTVMNVETSASELIVNPG